MSSLEKVRKHFDQDAERFDSIYESEKPLVHRLTDRYIRGVVAQRFQFIRNVAPLPGNWSVLDVGCGSGRFTIDLARSGANPAVGIDVSEKMTEMAAREAEQQSVSDRCRFETTDFLSCELDRQFDVVLGIGYFDYLESPLPHLKKMVEHCSGRIFASFPKRFEWRVPTRKLRFLLSGGYVRFYSHKEVEDLVLGAGIPADRASLIDFGRDWVLVARTAS